MKKSFLVFCLCMIAALSSTACIPTSAVFPAIAAVVSDATTVMSIIQRAVDTWFVYKPNPELEEEINAAILDTQSALRAAIAATKGAENISQEDYDAAFKDFQQAYKNLNELLKKHGILKGTKLSAGPNHPSYDIPEPLALSHKVK